MTSLTPEQRLDKNGRLVTRHVRTGPAASPALASLPKVSLGTSKQQKVRKPSTTQKVHLNIKTHWADGRLKEITNMKHRGYDTSRIRCSNAEAYDVFSVVGSPHNTLRLLAAGIRSKEDAIQFLSENDLSDLQQDGSEVMDELISRGIPAVPAMESLQRFGLDRMDHDNFFDAVEANSVRALREATGSPIDVPHMVWMGEISMDDVKVIGATRLAKSRDIYSVMDQLKEIKNGTSPYDAETLLQLVIIGDNNHTDTLNDPIRAAGRFGTDMVLGLKHYSRAMNVEGALRNTPYNTAERGEIIQLHDALLDQGKHLNTTGLRIVYDAGVEVKDVVDGLDKGLELSEIAAIKEGIEPSVSSGWL
jgi:hypothetical protein